MTTSAGGLSGKVSVGQLRMMSRLMRGVGEAGAVPVNHDLKKKTWGKEQKSD